MWGNFFYNVSYAVSTISGCKMSSQSNYVTVLGVANSLPIVMLLDKTDGSIDTFLTVQTFKKYTTTPSFSTNAAIYYDEADANDGNAYIYVSFLMTLDSMQKMYVLRFKTDSSLAIDWSYSYYQSSSYTYKPL
jgi:hypothetical protein